MAAREGRGVVPGQIAFIQDFDNTSKASLFKNVREAKVRVLPGSTARMAEGTDCKSGSWHRTILMRRGVPLTSSSARPHSPARLRE